LEVEMPEVSVLMAARIDTLDKLDWALEALEALEAVMAAEEISNQYGIAANETYDALVRAYELTAAAIAKARGE